MSTTAEHEPIEEQIKQAVRKERARCLGLVLAAYGSYKLAGQEAIARALDELATVMEHG